MITLFYLKEKINLNKEYKVELNKEDKAFYLMKNSEKLGHLIYTLDEDNKMTLTSTEVDPSLKGEGLGINLINAGVDFAREKGYKLDATCPYAVLMLDRNKEDFKDVISKDFKA